MARPIFSKHQQMWYRLLRMAIVFCLLFAINVALFLLFDCYSIGHCFGLDKGNWVHFIFGNTLFWPTILTCLLELFFSNQSFKDYGLKSNKMGLKHFAFGIGFAFALFVGFEIVEVTLGPYKVGWSLDNTKEYIAYQIDHFQLEPIFLFSLILITPIIFTFFSEFLFRGLILSMWSSSYGIISAIIVTNILFSLYSSYRFDQTFLDVISLYSVLSMDNLIWHFSLGILSSLLVLKTRQLWLSMGLVLGLQMLPMMSGYLGYYYRSSDTGYIMNWRLLDTSVLILATIIFYVKSGLFRQHFPKKPKKIKVIEPPPTQLQQMQSEIETLSEEEKIKLRHMLDDNDETVN